MSNDQGIIFNGRLVQIYMKDEKIQELAMLLAPDFYRMSSWNVPIFMQWARDIIKSGRNPYCKRHSSGCMVGKKRHNRMCKPINDFLEKYGR